jgi:hypothetical protein
VPSGRGPFYARRALMLVQLSDMHLRAGEDGRRPATRLEHALRRVAALQMLERLPGQ